MKSAFPRSSKVLFILMPSKFRDEEFSTPYHLLKEMGCRVDVAGLQEGVAVGVNGFRFNPNVMLNNLADHDLDRYDAVVVPGGPGSAHSLWENQGVLHILQYFHEKGKIVATICLACVILAQAGLLKGKKATVFLTDETKRIFSENGVLLSEEGCVVLADEKIVTAQGPNQAIQFGQAILSLMQTHARKG